MPRLRREGNVAQAEAAPLSEWLRLDRYSLSLAARPFYHGEYVVMSKTLVAISVLVLSLALPHAHAEEQQQSQGAAAPVFNPFDLSTWTGIGQPQAPFPNWYDPSAWMAAGRSPMALNLAHPAGWAEMINPYTHTGVHTAMMNPATYAQFMQPQFWMQFMNPNNWLAWMNPASYATFLNPMTYLGWLNPAAYTHVMHPGMYMQLLNLNNYMPFLNPTTYLSWLNPAAYGLSRNGVNWLDPSTWDQAAQPPAEAKPNP